MREVRHHNSGKSERKRTAIACATCLVLLFIASCSGSGLLAIGATPIPVKARTLTLEWDPPPGSSPAGPFSLSSYHVYYRVHGAALWILCSTVPATENPECILKHHDFGDGEYDFAVAAVSALGAVSPLHGSLDPTASPFGGWYVIWNGPADK
jgi:hypothetical protein